MTEQAPKLNFMRVVFVTLFALILVTVELITGFVIYHNALAVGYNGVYARYQTNITSYTENFVNTYTQDRLAEGATYDRYGDLHGQTLTVDGQTYTVKNSLIQKSLTTDTVGFYALGDLTDEQVEGDEVYAVYSLPQANGSVNLQFRSAKLLAQTLSMQGFDGIFLVSSSGRIVGNITDSTSIFFGYLSGYGVTVDSSETTVVRAGINSYALSVSPVGQTDFYACGYANFSADAEALTSLRSQITLMVCFMGAFTAAMLIAGIVLAGSRGLFRQTSYRIVTNADGVIVKADKQFQTDFPHVQEIKEQVTRFNEYEAYAIKLPSVDGEKLLACDVNRRGNGTVVLKARTIEVPFGSEVNTGISQTFEDTYELLIKKAKVALVGELYIGNLHNIKTMFGREFSSKVREIIMKRLRDRYLVVCEIDYYTIGILYPDERHLKQLLEDLPELMAEVNRPVQIGNDLVTVGVKGGFALADRAMQAKHYAYIVTAVGAALKRAQTEKECDYYLYDESQKKVYSKYFFQIDIREMLQNGDFELQYQPQYDLHEDKITGFEALFRVKKRVEMNAGPYQIITYAERTGNMVLLGDFIFDTGMRFAKSVEGMGVTVSLNVSPVQLMQAGFVERFLELYRKYDLPAGLICVEVTESFLMTTFEETVQKLNILRDNGICVHLDDFGTDYSSLLYLKKLPIDIIKVDKEFVSDISTNEYSRSITAMVINLAHELKLQNICEGIETEEQLAIVRDLGCDIIQGYIVGKSQPEDVAREMISTFRLPANSSSKTK